MMLLHSNGPNLWKPVPYFQLMNIAKVSLILYNKVSSDISALFKVMNEVFLFLAHRNTAFRIKRFQGGPVHDFLPLFLFTSIRRGMRIV